MRTHFHLSMQADNAMLFSLWNWVDSAGRITLSFLLFSFISQNFRSFIGFIIYSFCLLAFLSSILMHTLPLIILCCRLVCLRAHPTFILLHPTESSITFTSVEGSKHEFWPDSGEHFYEGSLLPDGNDSNLSMFEIQNIQGRASFAKLCSKTLLKPKNRGQTKLETEDLLSLLDVRLDSGLMLFSSISWTINNQNIISSQFAFYQNEFGAVWGTLRNLIAIIWNIPWCF